MHSLLPMCEGLNALIKHYNNEIGFSLAPVEGIVNFGCGVLAA